MSKVVLITGCSNGIGRLTADLFAKRGWNVAATARRPEMIELNGNMQGFQLDVTCESSIAAAVEAVVERFGTIDVVVNNAGFGLFVPLEGISPAQCHHLQGARGHPSCPLIMPRSSLLRDFPNHCGLNSRCMASE